MNRFDQVDHSLRSALTELNTPPPFDPNGERYSIHYRIGAAEACIKDALAYLELLRRDSAEAKEVIRELQEMNERAQESA
jgi:hypothetical protein